MSPKRALTLALLVAFAGCTGVGTTGDVSTTTGATTTVPTTQSTTVATTDSTTEQHTAVGTSHNSGHFSVRAGFDVENLTVTLAPDGNSETYSVNAGEDLDLTQEIHERGHGVRVVVERGDEVVFDQSIYDYEDYEVSVYEDDVSVQLSEV